VPRATAGFSSSVRSVLRRAIGQPGIMGSEDRPRVSQWIPTCAALRHTSPRGGLRPVGAELSRRVVQLIEDDKARLHMDTPFGTWLHVAAGHGRLDIVNS